MLIADTIAERKTLRALAWRFRVDGKWDGAETEAEKAAILPVERAPVELTEEQEISARISESPETLAIVEYFAGKVGIDKATALAEITAKAVLVRAADVEIIKK